MNDITLDWGQRTKAMIDDSPRFTVFGRVTRVIGQVVEVTSLPVAVGEMCRIAPDDDYGILAQVAGFHELRRRRRSCRWAKLQLPHPG